MKALEYSRSLRTGNQLIEETEVFQPAVFKVEYLGELDDTDLKVVDLTINEGSWSETYNLNERMSRVRYFEVSRVNVIPLEGTLKIHTGAKGNYRIHKPVIMNI